jgi:hypothetical protein
VLFVFQGDLDAAREVFDGLWPEARAVSDPTLDLYKAFGLGRGGFLQMFGPGVWRRAFEARRKGFSQGKTVGDPWLMPGAFLIEDGVVVRRHDYAHAGDQPDFSVFVAPGD